MTFSEWFIDKKNKAKKFYNEHKIGCRIAIGSICLIVVGGVSYIIGKNAGENSVTIPEDIWDKIESSNNEENEFIECEELKQLIEDISEDDTDSLSKDWSEEYREGWNAVNELAKSLNLKDGESYIIERNSEYSDEPIISHMIDYTGVYPPEDE